MTRLMLSSALTLSLALILGSETSAAEETPKTPASAESLQESALPAPVAKTFRAQFPKAEIQKLTAEEEEGVMVYDFEFKDGESEKETDIAADGTMMEWTLVISSATVPPAAMKSITSAAKGAKLGRIERIEMQYKTEDGKVVRLPEVMTRYAAEMSKDQQMAEVVVNPDGSVVDQPEWVKKPQTKPSK